MSVTPHRALTPLALAVLELLLERAMHPYEMHQLIRDRRIDHVIKLRAGSLYHTVERPQRTVYAITEQGRDAFAARMRDLIQRPEPEYPVFGAAVEMLHTLDPTEAATLLERRTVALEAMVAGHDQVITTLGKSGLERVLLLEIEYAQAVRRAELAWVRELVDDIRGGALTWAAPAASGTVASGTASGAAASPPKETIA